MHAFIVPLRDDGGALWPGVEIHDCGYKVGVEGEVCGWVGWRAVGGGMEGWPRGGWAGHGRAWRCAAPRGSSCANSALPLPPRRRRWASTASTTEPSASPACGCRARTCSTASPQVGRRHGTRPPAQGRLAPRGRSLALVPRASHAGILAPLQLQPQLFSQAERWPPLPLPCCRAAVQWTAAGGTAAP